MDFFKGIGNFFGGLFGGNKDDEERKRKQQQAQQQAQSKAQPTPMQGNKQNTNNWLDTNPLTAQPFKPQNSVLTQQGQQNSLVSLVQNKPQPPKPTQPQPQLPPKPQPQPQLNKGVLDMEQSFKIKNNAPKPQPLTNITNSIPNYNVMSPEKQRQAIADVYDPPEARLARLSKKMEDDRKMRDGVKNFAEFIGNVPVVNTGANLSTWLASAAGELTGNKSLRDTADNTRNMINLGMTNQELNALPKGQRDKLSTVGNVASALSPLDVWGATSIAKAPIIGGVKQAAKEGIMSEAGKNILKQTAKETGKQYGTQIAIGAGAGGAINPAIQAYVNDGKVDWSSVPSSMLQGGLWAAVLPEFSEKSRLTKNMDIKNNLIHNMEPNAPATRENSPITRVEETPAQKPSGISTPNRPEGMNKAQNFPTKTEPQPVVTQPVPRPEPQPVQPQPVQPRPEPAYQTPPQTLQDAINDINDINDPLAPQRPVEPVQAPESPLQPIQRQLDEQMLEPPRQEVVTPPQVVDTPAQVQARQVQELNATQPKLTPEQVAAHKSPEGFVDDVVNRIWERNKTGQGVDTWLTPDDYGSGFSRRNAMSNNSPFYQDFYAEYGRKPSKTAIRDMVEQELGIKSSQDGIHNARLLVDNQEMAPVDRDVFRQLAEREDGLNNLVNSADIHHELMQTDPKYAATAARAEAIRGAITEAEARGGANPSRLEALKQEHDMLQSGLVGARTSSSDALQAKSAKAQSRHIKTLQELPTAPTRNQSHRQHVAQQSDTQYRNHAHSTPDNTPGALSRTAPPAHQNQPQLPHRSEFPHTQLDPYGSSMTQKQADDYTKAMSKSQDIARNDGIASKIEKIKSSKSDFKEKFIDDMAPIEDRLNRAIKNGAIVDPQDHITYQIDRSRRSEGITHAYIQDNGLDKIIQGVPDTKKFDQYLIAKHAAALDPEIMTGRNGRKDYALVNALKDEYEPFAKKLYAYNQKLLDTSVEYGLISKDTASMLKKKYPEYVPLNRIFNEGELAKISGSGGGEASISKQTVVQRIKGSERAIDSPLNSIIDKTRVVVEQGERNKAAKMLVSYKNLPNNPFNLHKLPDGEAIGTRSAVSFLENGKKVTYLTDKSIADAAKGMTRQQIGLWGRILSVPTRVLRMGATSANAGFAGANVVKDLVGAAINSKHSMRIAQPDVFGKALAAALKHDGKYYRELMREGIAGTSFDMYRNAPNLNIREIRSHKNLAARSLENMRHPLRTIENTIGRSEDFGRALQYYSNKAGFEKEFGKGSRKATILAGDQARSNSTNFFRHGSYGKNINLAIPYWNAGVQGARIQARRLIERPAQTLAKIGFAIAAPSAMIAMNNYGSDEKRKIMDRIPDYEKEGNIIIIGDNARFNEDSGRWEGVTKIPIPPQHLGIHNAIQQAVISHKTGKSFDIVQALGGIAENYSTVNPTDLRKTANNYTPQMAKLIAEPATNTNFYSREKIVPDSMKNLDKQDQKSKSTSLTAQYLAKATGESPLMIDNLIRTATGGAGQNVVRLTDTGIARATGREDKEIKGRDVVQSITDRFVGARGISDGMLYYKSLDEAAKKNKLAGKDLAIFNSLADAKMGADGEIVGTTERDALNKYQNLASRPNVARAIADAALARSKKTGEPVDPLYRLSHEKQMKFYNIKAQNKDSQDQRDLENRESGWYKDFSKQRRDYFSKLDIPESKNSLRVKYPEVSADVQKKIDTYFAMPNGDGKYAYMDANPEIGQHFKALSKYSNDVRVAQGVNPLRTYPEASKRVQGLMDTGNFKDPEVSKYLQDMNLYNITKDSALAQIQGNDMTPKSLKAINSMGRYGLVKNPDGSFALKYSDAQGSGRTSIQPGAVDGSGFGVRSRKGGGRKGRGGRSGSGSGSGGKARGYNMPTSLLSSKSNSAPDIKRGERLFKAPTLVSTAEKTKSRIPNISVKKGIHL